MGVHMLVAYGVRQDGTRHLLAFLRSRGESQADWEGSGHNHGSFARVQPHPPGRVIGMAACKHAL